MTAPVRLPHVSQGNLLTDVSQAAAALAGGLQAENIRRREEAMRAALLEVQRLNAEANMRRALQGERPFLEQSPFEPDPITGKARAGAEHVLIDPATGQSTRTGVETVPPKPIPPWMVPIQMPGGGEGVVGVERRTGFQAFPQGGVRDVTARQQTRMLEPSTEQTQRAGLTRTLIQSRKQLNQMAQADPGLGQRAGLINMLSTMAPGAKAEDALGALFARLTGDPVAQAYIAEMLNFTSSYAFARGGKALTTNELAILLPQAFGFGLETGPAGKQRSLIRQRLEEEALTTLGDEGLVYALERGLIEPSDVPNLQLFLDRIRRFYGREVVVPPSQEPAKPYSRFRTQVPQ